MGVLGDGPSPLWTSTRMQMQSPIRLSDISQITFARQFHVEVLRGGMNRLLLRAIPTTEATSRIEVLFQYVQHLDMPMKFNGLLVRDATRETAIVSKYADLLRRFPECRVFRLESDGVRMGEVVAAACLFGEDSAPIGAESMFPMMS